MLIAMTLAATALREDKLERLARARHLAASGEARRVRLHTQTSLSEIAEACSVDTATVWRWETGTRRPRGDAALRYGSVIELLARTIPADASLVGESAA